MNAITQHADSVPQYNATWTTTIKIASLVSRTLQLGTEKINVI
jgi:hypothetical protein